MEYIKAFLKIERAFWHRVFFVKPLMIMFMFGAPAMSLFIIGGIATFNSFWWWFFTGYILLGFYVALPMAWCLTSPRILFPEEKI